MSAMEIADRTSFLSEDWLAFKQVLRFLNSAGQFLNGVLHDVTGDFFFQITFASGVKTFEEKYKCQSFPNIMPA